MNNIEIIVYVSCATYNQSQYIIDTLDGFCKQQTNFPFVCGIIDDASTDGEPEVIQKYIEDNFELDNNEIVRFSEDDNCKRLFARHRNNLNCYFVVVFLKYNHYSIKKTRLPYIAEWREKAKYIAMCEGDDYWTDSLKLQKQVDFMESHPENSLCFCNNIKLYPDGREEMVPRYPNDMESCPISDLIREGGGAMSTHTIMYRNSLYVPYNTWAKNCPVGDLPMMLSLAAKGKVGFLSDVVGVHRFEAKGSWTVSISEDTKRKRKLNADIIKMYKLFDVWTEKKYHSEVVKKIWNIRLTILKGEVRNCINKINNHKSLVFPKKINK